MTCADDQSTIYSMWNSMSAINMVYNVRILFLPCKHTLTSSPRDAPHFGWHLPLARMPNVRLWLSLLKSPLRGSDGRDSLSAMFGQGDPGDDG